MSVTPAMTRLTNPRLLSVIRIAFLMYIGVIVIVIIPIQSSAYATRLDDASQFVSMYKINLLDFNLTIPFFAAFLVTVGDIVLFIYVSIALLIFSRRSDDWMVIFTAVVVVSAGVGESNANVSMGHLLQQPFWWWWLAFLISMADTWGVFFLLCLFPDGHFVPRWLRWLVIPDFIWTFIRIYLNFNPSLLPPNNVFWSISFPSSIAWLAIPIAAQVYRYRRVATPVQRQQIKWIIWGWIVWLGLIVLTILFPTVFLSSGNPTLDVVYFFIYPTTYAIAFIVLPVTLIFSVLRYGLYEVDFVLNRSLVYGTVTVFMAVVFLGSGFLLQAILGQKQPGIAFAVAILGAGLLFNPARKAAQRFVDRRIYGLKFDLNQLADAQKLPDVKNPGALSGRKLGDYEVLDAIGKGGMGEVYKGQANGQIVALKVLPDDLAKQEEFRKRFEREAQTLTALNHPNIVHMLGSGTSDGILYLAMDYIDGVELGDKLKRNGALRLDEAREIVKVLASALDYAHEQGFVHRDIKPSNVMLRRGKDGETTEAVLMDFGVAKIREAHTGLTSTGAIGTIDYMAPEQIMAAKTVDQRADVYALGIMVYEMLTGERPFKGGAAQVMFAHIQQPAPDPRDVNEAIPRQIANVVQQALAKKPDERFATAGEFAAKLFNN